MSNLADLNLVSAQSMHDQVVADINKHFKELKVLKNRALKANRKVAAKEDEIKTAERNKVQFKVLVTAIQLLRDRRYSSICTLRGSILSNMNLLKSDDITRRQETEIRARLGNSHEGIQKACLGHPFVIHRQGYAGSLSRDHEDKYPDERTCALCGFVEKGISGQYEGSSETFKQLVEKDDRVVVPEPYVPHPQTYSIWKPLEQVLADCVNRRVVDQLTKTQ